MSPGNGAIKLTDEITPSGATAHTQGVRKGRLALGSLSRRMGTPAQTRANAKRVPMLVSSPSTVIGRNAAVIATSAPVKMVVTCGVRKRRWTDANTGGWPIIMTRITEVRPRMAPILTMAESQPRPTASIPTAMGSGTLRVV